MLIILHIVLLQISCKMCLLFSLTRYYFYLTRFDSASNNATAPTSFKSIFSSSSIFICRKKPSRLMLAILLLSCIIIIQIYLKAQKSYAYTKYSYLLDHQVCILQFLLITMNIKRGKALSFISWVSKLNSISQKKSFIAAIFQISFKAKY